MLALLLLGGYLWAGLDPGDTPLSARFPAPPGYTRVAAPAGGFAAWLRELPLLPGNPEVRLHRGAPKRNQSAHAAVVDIDVGSRDLQQCADAVIRLRAEYLFAAGRAESAVFRFTSGDRAAFSDWAAGKRPVVPARGPVRWVASAGPDDSHASYRRWLDTVFQYAGTRSLVREMGRTGVAGIQAGDVLVQAGSPGHAVTVLDVAQDARGHRVFLLAQSYMPAQQIEVLRNPATGDAWFEAVPGQPLTTPEWVFPADALMRWP